MPNRLFQGTIHQMRDYIDRTVGVIDDEGRVIACSDPSKLDSSREHLALDLSEGHIFVRDGYTYQPLDSVQQPEYSVFVEGTDEMAARYAGILAVSISGIRQYYEKKYTRGSFIKSVIQDSILPEDIPVKARELHFNTEMARVVLLVRIVSASGVPVIDAIQNFFPDKQKDFVFPTSEHDVAIVTEISQDVESKDLEKLARSIADTLSGVYNTHVAIGIGTVVVGVKDLTRSFQEAQAALEIGQAFDAERAIFRYDDLGIARLIYQLPVTLCAQFLSEVFVTGSIESLDQETLFTIQTFFENNLNVSETARKLFIHRSTLVYRLEKIKKLTGLDLREFSQAITFEIALMVKKHLNANPAKY